MVLALPCFVLNEVKIQSIIQLPFVSSIYFSPKFVVCNFPRRSRHFRQSTVQPSASVDHRSDGEQRKSRAEPFLIQETLCLGHRRKQRHRAGNSAEALDAWLHGVLGFQVPRERQSREEEARRGQCHVIEGNCYSSCALPRGDAKGDIEVVVVDLDDQKSIDAAVASVKARTGYLDVLINNAALVSYDFDVKTVKQSMATNYQGTVAVTESFLPLVVAGGRIIFVSSAIGKTYLVPLATQKRLLSSELTPEGLSTVICRAWSRL
jgi:short chain dehydrogenase